MEIVLTDQEMNYAAGIGRSRNSVNRLADQSDGCVKDSITIDVQGAQAEFACAKAFGVEWDGKLYNYEKWLVWREIGHDVGQVEVRSTKHKTGRLIIHPNDNDYSPYVLVRAHLSPKFIIVGWQWGCVGKKSEYWHDVGYGRPCYYLPNNKLRPIQDLIENLFNNP